MKTLNNWLTSYANDHQNPINQKVHIFCVPAITWSLIGLLSLLPALHLGAFLLEWQFVVIAVTSLFYFRLNLVVAIAITLIHLLYAFISQKVVTSGLPALEIFLGVFILAWIGQFWGHKVEGKKPSFFTDLAYLLIGPIWVLMKVIPGFKSRFFQNQ